MSNSGVFVASDQGKLERHFKIISYLRMSSEENALSISEIHNRLKKANFDIDRRTVSRDINDLSHQHQGLAQTDGTPAKYFFLPGYKVNYPIDFEDKHLQTIIIALHHLQMMGCPTVASLCEETEQVLLGKLSRFDRDDFEKLQSRSTIAKTVLGKSQGTKKDTYTLLFDCLQHGYAFNCIYISPYKNLPEQRIFHPLKLHFVGGAPYLIVYDSNDNNEIKMLRMSRIESVEKTQIPVDHSKAEKINLEHSFGAYGLGSEKVIDYKIHCRTPMAMKFKEQKIHDSQEIRQLDNSLYEITFTLNDSLEIIKYLSQFAESIEMVEPVEVYERIRAIWRSGLKVA